MKRIAIALAALMMLVDGEALAEVKTFSGRDRMDDSTYKGVKLTSINRTASIRFICDSGSDILRILFHNDKFLALSGDAFPLHFRIDSNAKEEHYFTARPGSMSGRFTPKISSKHSLREAIDRLNRQMDDELGRNTRPHLKMARERELKISRIRVVNEFANGKTALIRVWGAQDAYYTYEFKLVGLKPKLDVIKDCYP